MELRKELREREKELTCLYRLTSMFASFHGEEDELLDTVAGELREAMTYPGKTGVRLFHCTIPGEPGETADTAVFYDRVSLDENESICIHVSGIGGDMEIVPRERSMLQTALELTAGALKRFRYEKAVIMKNAALKELIEQLKRDEENSGRELRLKINAFISPLLNQITSSLEGEKLENFNLLRREILSLADTGRHHLERLSSLLTPRELEICGLISNGAGSKDIASLLGISPETVERHRCTIRKKLNLNGTRINLKTYLINL